MSSTGMEATSQTIRRSSSEALNDRLIPLVVDLDGTLLRTDLLVESFFALAGANLLAASKALFALRDGRAALKAKLADIADIDIGSLPLNADVVNFVATERGRGRPIYLASASDERYVRAVADHFELFDGSFGSTASLNLAGSSKAAVLIKAFGVGGFDYIGNSSIDESVWRVSREVIVANAHQRYVDSVRQWALTARDLGTRHGHFFAGGRESQAASYLRALRVHQWLKNLLILVPAIAAHQFGAPLFNSMIAFVSFSLCASSVYILNDLVDLRSDRAHERKRHRPFASGAIPLVQGAFIAPALLVLSVGIGLFLPPKFLLILFGYYALTCSYSFWLKRKALVDVVSLACLYGTRLLAGGAASGLALSPWLAAFSIFLFFCLALVKRCAELGDRQESPGALVPGRGYRADDLPALMSMAASSGFVSVLVMALYLNSDAVRTMYSRPKDIWVICVFLMLWISRTLLLTHRGQMHDDPVVFAAKDRVSAFIAVACLFVLIISL